MNKVKKKKEKKWSTLQHNGILFPPVYEAKGLSISINGKKTALTPLQEEMAWTTYIVHAPSIFAGHMLRYWHTLHFAIALW